MSLNARFDTRSDLDKNSSCAISLCLHVTRTVVLEAAWTSYGWKRDFRAVTSIHTSFI